MLIVIEPSLVSCMFVRNLIAHENGDTLQQAEQRLEGRLPKGVAPALHDISAQVMFIILAPSLWHAEIPLFIIALV